MPIDIVDIHNGQGNYIIAYGILTEKELLDSLKAHLTQDEDKLKKYRFSFSDYTGIVGIDEISNQAVNTIASLCSRAAKINPEVVAPVIAEQDFVYGLARMWQGMMGENDWEVKVYKSKKEAIPWLVDRVKIKYDIDINSKDLEKELNTLIQTRILKTLMEV
jgi:hypothetical protein